jgi:hypothetical protein
MHGISGQGRLVRTAARELQRRFGIVHVTLQIEPDGAGGDCVLAPDEIV